MREQKAQVLMKDLPLIEKEENQTDGIRRLDARHSTQIIIFQTRRGSVCKAALGEWQGQNEAADCKEKIDAEMTVVAQLHQPRLIEGRYPVRLRMYLDGAPAAAVQVDGHHVMEDHRRNGQKAQAVNFRN